MKGQSHHIFGKLNKDRRKVDTNAKYDNLFDQFGNRKDQSKIHKNYILDPLASSKERRKDKLNITKQNESDFSPIVFNNLRPSRRLYKGVYK